MDEIEGLDGELEDEVLARLVKDKRPKKNPKAEAEKKAGDQQRANLRMRGYKPLPVQLRGYAFDIKSTANDWDDHLGQRVYDHGDIDTSVMIDRMLATQPPESTPSLKKQNELYSRKRLKAKGNFKNRRAREKGRRKAWKTKRT